MGNKDNAKELLPCPFCGGEARTKVAMDGRTGICIWSQCIVCGTRTATYSIDITYNEDPALSEIKSAKEKAIEEWNRRTTNETD